MIIKGANLGNVQVEYKKLSEYNWTDDNTLKEKIIALENLYYSLYEKSKESEITPMMIDETNHVIIKSSMVNHRCHSDINTLKTISEFGVLASEWFGILEDEREGCFCTFVSRMKKEDYPFKGDLAEDNYSRLNIGKNVILFFDETSPIMQYLLHLDYFEFEHIKKTAPDVVNQIYEKEEIELLEKLIEPLSPGGLDMRKNYDFKTNYWSAIPGGIPPFLINGICIKNNNYSDEELDIISNLFPRAVVFNSKKEVIRYPSKLKNIETKHILK